MFRSCRNQSINLQSKHIDWFLYNRNTSLKLVNSKEITTVKTNIARVYLSLTFTHRLDCPYCHSEHVLLADGI